MQSRTESNDIEIRQTIQEIGETKSWFFGKTKLKREKSQIINKRNERGIVTIYYTEKKDNRVILGTTLFPRNSITYMKWTNFF